MAEIERLKNAPKTLSVALIKEAGNPLKLDRLDGFNATISGSGGTFTSTAITTDDAGVKGTCRFNTPLPPGDYTFSLGRIGVSQKITIAKEPKTSLSAILTFTRAGSLVIDVR